MEIESRSNHVNIVGFRASAAPHFGDRHSGFLGQQFRQMALVFRIEVLNQHERHAGIVRQMAKQFRECLQPACRRAHSDNHRTRVHGRLSRRRLQSQPPRSRLRLCGLRPTVFFAKHHHDLSGAGTLTILHSPLSSRPRSSQQIFEWSCRFP